MAENERQNPNAEEIASAVVAALDGRGESSHRGAATTVLKVDDPAQFRELVAEGVREGYKRAHADLHAEDAEPKPKPEKKPFKRGIVISGL
jgi:hypothetical protein